MSAYLPHRLRLRTLLALLDGSGLALAGWLAYEIRFTPAAKVAQLDRLLASPGLLLAALGSGWILTIAADLYEPEVLHRRREVLVRVVVMVAAWSASLVLYTYLSPNWAFGRGLLILTAGFWTILLIASRWALSAWLRGKTKAPALVLGDPEAVAQYCQELAARPSAPWMPVDGSHIALEEIPHKIANTEASMVILAGGDGHYQEMGQALTDLHFSGVPVVVASETWAWLEERLPLEALSPAIFLHQPGFGAVHWTLFNRLTRVLDVVLASLLLVLTFPIFLLAAIALVLTDGFPVLYRQERVGQFGRPFTMLKMRTMARDAERSGPEFAARRDPRVVAIGHLLRRLRIDELPQLLNILRGQMSLVGPRPERPEFMADLSRQIPYYAFRLAVQPGLTGWAQVNVPYARDLEEHKRKLEFDLYFIRERSMRLYLLTLLRTASAALVGVRD